MIMPGFNLEGDDIMDIIWRSPNKYGLQKIGKKCHRIYKILREYDNEQVL